MSTIVNYIKTVFKADGVTDVVDSTEKVGRAQTRLGSASTNTSRAFAAQASGLGGLVSAYAGAAATAFALEASFSALARSARAAQTFEGLGVLAAKSGEDASKLLATVQEITKSQLTLTSAAEQINLSLTAGFSGKQIEGLSEVALKASRALGRDLADSLTRVTRGSAKMETELLDELGIYTKIEPATAAYAAAIGKTRLELTDYERRQAFVNSVIAEGQRKFSAINTVIPTTAEKIEAFGATVINLATQFGIFLSDKLAPIADFLTNNLSAAFGVVGLAASIVAAKGVQVLKAALESLSTMAQKKASAVEDYFLRFSKAALTARDAAQKALSSVVLTKGVGGSDQAALKQLKEQAKLRTLTGKELDQASGILARRSTQLEIRQKEEQASIASLKAEKAQLESNRSAMAKDSAALANNTTELEKNRIALESRNKALATSNMRMAETKSQQAAVAAAMVGTTSGIAKFFSGTITGAMGVAKGIAHAGASIVGFGSSVLSGVAILSLMGSTLAELIGMQDEYNAFMKLVGTTISNFFSSVDSKNAQKAFVSLSDAALTSIQAADTSLRELDSFTFKTKVLGVEVEITKTKEDLIREVSDALATAGSEGNKSLGESLISTSGSVGAAAGYVVKGVVTRAITPALTAAGAAIGTAILPGVGTAIGAALAIAGGLAAGAFADQFLVGLDSLPEDIKNKLRADYGKDLFAGDTGDKLSKALQIIEDQAGAAKNLSIEGRIYYETQQKIAVQIAKNLNNFRELQEVASQLGTDAATIEKNFTTGSDKLKNLTITPKLDLPDTIELAITFINQEKALADIDALAKAFEAAKLQDQKVNPRIAMNLYGSLDRSKVDILNYQRQIADLQALKRQAEIDQSIAQSSPSLDGELGNADYSAATNEISALNYAIQEANASILAIQISAGLVDTTLSSIQTDSVDKINASANKFLQIQNELSITNAKVATSFIDLRDSIQSGSINLEQLAQKEDLFNRQNQEAAQGLVSLEAELNKQRVERASLINSTGFAENKQLVDSVALLDAQIAGNEYLLGAQKALVVANTQNAVALSNSIAPLKEQLQLVDTLQKAFGDLTQDKSKGYGMTSAAGELLSNPDDIRARQATLLNEELAKSLDLYKQQERQMKVLSTFGKLLGFTKEQNTALSMATAETIEAEATRVGIADEYVALLKSIVTLTNAEVAAATNVNTILNIKNNLLAEAKDKFENQSDAYVKSALEAIRSLNAEMTNLRSSNNIANLQFTIDKLSLEAEAANAAAAFEQKFKENQIQLVQLQVENKKVDPVDGAQQINALSAEIQAIQERNLEAQRALAQQNYMASVKLQLAEFEATKKKIIAEGKQLEAKVKAEYQILVSAASVYTEIANNLNSAIVDGGNSMGQVIVSAVNAGARALASAFGPMGKLLGIGAGFAAATFTPQNKTPVETATVNPAAGGVDAFIESMSPMQTVLAEASTATGTHLTTIQESTQLQLDLAEESYQRNNELGMQRRAEEIRDFDRQKALLMQKENISKEEAEKRLREAKDAGGGGGGEKAKEVISEIEKKLKALFDSIKGHVETVLMSLNNLVFYGEGNFSEIMSNFFKSVQQDFFKQTIAQPVSEALTGSLFSLLGVNQKTNTKGEKGLTYEGNSLLVKVVNAGDFMMNNLLGGQKDGADAKEGTGDVVSSLLGKDGTIANMFTKLFGQGGILSNLLGGFGNFLGTIFKALFGGIFGRASGGAVHMAQGGSASSSLHRDRIPAMLEPGEFVIRKPIARMIGAPALNSLNATGSMPNNSAPTINIVNEGTPKDVQASQPRFDGDKYVIDVIMRDLSNNGPIRRSLRGGAI